MVHSVGVEPTTNGFEDRYSIQLSYECKEFLPKESGCSIWKKPRNAKFFWRFVFFPQKNAGYISESPFSGARTASMFLLTAGTEYADISRFFCA